MLYITVITMVYSTTIVYHLHELHQRSTIITKTKASKLVDAITHYHYQYFTRQNQQEHHYYWYVQFAIGILITTTTLQQLPTTYAYQPTTIITIITIKHHTTTYTTKPNPILPTFTTIIII